ncbi:dUTP diphosphatase [Simiduia aestuariiviva]|uniref:Dimeric dUTPase (All-alpha-NTP-PPase superfamily) n=1 Tax=Simiduia aestuariiviva TaxID=1510459 RepID=A0A839UJD1_9GAMM|nr:dUTP diphosphatase [Simiduia aestuariiviva]MBB3168214.1 dimeric dUTPase (all-alpha-NTP-PPase superfamily) [Simiduia aestuariiviva]
MRAQLEKMLVLQDSMNAKVNPEWRAQNFAWYRAIWVECAELLDHYGWKWWKKQQPDVEQVRLELIDIWHFGLSMVLTEQPDPEQRLSYLAESLANLEPKELDAEAFRQELEAFAGEVITKQHFSVRHFARLLAGVGMGFDDLYTGYVGKNVLNFFRQDHGYKDGTYKKVWSGREDNEHLVDAVNALDHAALDFPEALYQALTDRYANA